MMNYRKNASLAGIIATLTIERDKLRADWLYTCQRHLDCLPSEKNGYRWEVDAKAKIYHLADDTLAALMALATK